MPKKRLNAGQMALALGRAEAGTTIGDDRGKMRIAVARLYRRERISMPGWLSRRPCVVEVRRGGGSAKSMTAELSVSAEQRLQNQGLGPRRFAGSLTAIDGDLEARIRPPLLTPLSVMAEIFSDSRAMVQGLLAPANLTPLGSRGP